MSQTDQHCIGRAELRREDERQLKGEGQFAADIKPDDLLHVVFARSPMPSCQIIQCDIDDAMNMDGVEAVFTGADVKNLGNLFVASTLEPNGHVDFPVLAEHSVTAVGQPIAAVIATSVNVALDAVDALFIDLEDSESDMTRAATFAGSWGSGDVDAGFEQADHIVNVSIQHPRLAPSPIEPRAVTVEFDTENDVATVWLATQTPHRARSELCKIIGISEECIRVVAVDVGGAFGMKASLYPEDVLTVWAAFKLKRSLQWVASRSEEFLSATHGRGGSVSGQLALTEEGRFLAIRASAEMPLGHWLPTSAEIPAWNAGRILPCGYRVDALTSSAHARTDNKAAVGIYRGAGRPEANCLMERLVDEAAAITGIDPIELRLANLLEASDFPYTTVSGCTLDSGQYREAVQRLAREVDYPNLKIQRKQRRDQGELVGIGVAFYIEPCGTGWESARVTLNPDGSVIAATGGSSQGHGRETAIAQIVADKLTVPMQSVRVLHGDTKDCPAGIGALASRSTAIGGSAIGRACDGILSKLPVDGKLKSPVTEEVVYEADGEAWGYGCYIICVSVDRDTGVVKIESAACIDDVGTIINPALVDGQIRGGFAQGIGEALLEEVIYDDDGQLLTGSFTDYTMPRSNDVPDLSIHKLSTPSPNNELGAKGCGEAGTIGTPAAVLNAVVDALRPLGVRDLQMPLTGQRVWNAMNAATERNTS